MEGLCARWESVAPGPQGLRHPHMCPCDPASLISMHLSFFIHETELRLLRGVLLSIHHSLSVCTHVHTRIVSWYACVHVDAESTVVVILQVLLTLGFVFTCLFVLG